MDYIEITQELAWHIQQKLPYCGRFARANSANSNRYVQVRTSFDVRLDPKAYVHFELRRGHIELHFEGGYDKQYSGLIRYLKDKTQKEKDAGIIEWFNWSSDEEDGCRLSSLCVTEEDVFNGFDSMQKLFNIHISAYLHPYEVIDIEEFEIPEVECNLVPTDEDVNLYELDLLNLLNLSLKIPDYQRIYCWNEKNVLRLLDDIFNAFDEYRLGTLILQRNEANFDIIDGQQRLVTLSLLLSEMGAKGIRLLEERIDDTQAVGYIKYNRYLIKQYLKRNKLFVTPLKAKELLKNLTFFVLVLNKDTIDLAYTFFSNENSKGEALTDFDLLKAHHLRYIDVEAQTKNLARRWNQMLLESGDDEQEKPHLRTLDIYLFRLRKWMRKKTWYEKEKYRVKNEYEAAPTIEEIPPYGERFDFYEPIQGGSHFFGYVDHFVAKYKCFAKIELVESLHKDLAGETHWFYRDAIEALLFAYYLKFGELYLNEAFTLIATRIAFFRLQYSRADFQKILERTGDTEIVLMIDQASSPTFFLQELQNANKKLSFDQSRNGVRGRFCHALRSIFEKYPSSIKSINAQMI